MIHRSIPDVPTYLKKSRPVNLPVKEDASRDALERSISNDLPEKSAF